MKRKGKGVGFPLFGFIKVPRGGFLKVSRERYF